MWEQKNKKYEFVLSPSFCTQQSNNQDQFQDDCNLVSYPSVSFSSDVSCFSQESLSINKNKQQKNKINQLNNKNINQQKSEYFPSLKSYQSGDIDQSGNIGQSGNIDQKFNCYEFKIKQNNLNFINQNLLNSLPSKQFIPDVRQLTYHIDFLQKEYFNIKKQYFKLKSFTQAIIDALKTTGSKQVGIKLQNYLLKNILNPSICSFINQQNSAKTLHLQSQLSSSFLHKISSQSLSYSHELQSQQLSDTIENIFTLGGQTNHIMKNLINQSPSNQSCKSTERKNKNFKKLKDNKENFMNMNISQNFTSKKSKNNNINSSLNKNDQKSQVNARKHNQKQMNKKSKINCLVNRSYDQKKGKNIQINESMKYLLQYANKNQYNNFQDEITERNLQKNRNLLIATSLKCEVCEECFRPNEFFNHLDKCSKHQTQNLSIAQQINNGKEGLDYTLLMQNLLFMKEQIQQQIQLLNQQRIKSKYIQKHQTQTLKLKLQQDLAKITKIIKAKQKQLKIYLPKSSQNDILGHNNKKLK